MLGVWAAILAFGTPIRTITSANPLHFQMKLASDTFRQKAQLCHILQIVLCGTNFWVFFRAAPVFPAIWVGRVASSCVGTCVLGKVTEWYRHSVPDAVVPSDVKDALE